MPGSNLIVIEVSEDNVFCVPIVIPSFSIRPLVNDQIFWKVREVMVTSLVDALNVNDQTYLLVVAIAPTSRESLVICRPPAVALVV